MTSGARIGDDSDLRPKRPKLSPFAVWRNQFGFVIPEDLLFLSEVPRRSSAFRDQNHLQVCARHSCQPCSSSSHDSFYGQPTDSFTATRTLSLILLCVSLHFSAPIRIMFALRVSVSQLVGVALSFNSFVVLFTLDLDSTGIFAPLFFRCF